MLIYQISTNLGSDRFFNTIMDFIPSLSTIEKTKFCLIRFNPPNNPNDIVSSYVDGFNTFLVFDESLASRFIPLLSKNDAKQLSKLPEFSTFSLVAGYKPYMQSIIGK